MAIKKIRRWVNNRTWQIQYCVPAKKSIYNIWPKYLFFWKLARDAMFFKVILIVIAKPLYLLSLGIKVCSVNHYCAFSAKGLHLVCKHRWMPSLMETNFLLNLVLGDLPTKIFLFYKCVLNYGQAPAAFSVFLYFCILEPRIDKITEVVSLLALKFHNQTIHEHKH